MLTGAGAGAVLCVPAWLEDMVAMVVVWRDGEMEVIKGKKLKIDC